MSDPGHEFESGVREWLVLADALLAGCGSEVSRGLITEQLAHIQRVLQGQQRHVEAGLDEELQGHVAEIARLQESLHGIGQGQAEQTEAYDMLRLWCNLKMEEWQEAYDALRADTEDTEKTTLDRLVAILKVTFERCQTEVEGQHEALEFAVLFPGQEQSSYPQSGEGHTLPKHKDKDLDDHCTNCQVKTLQFCLPSIKKVLVTSIIEDKKYGKLFAAPTDRIQAAYRKYVSACVEFSWVASLEAEPVQLVTNPRKDCKPLLSQFHGEKEVPSKSYVEWPAIVQNDAIRATWQLFHRSRPKVLEKQKQVDTAKHTQIRVHERGQEKTNPPRAVVYEHENEWERGSASTGSINTYQANISYSSINSHQSSRDSQNGANYDYVQQWRAKNKHPNIHAESGIRKPRVLGGAEDTESMASGDSDIYHIDLQQGLDDTSIVSTSISSLREPGFISTSGALGKNKPPVVKHHGHGHPVMAHPRANARYDYQNF